MSDDYKNPIDINDLRTSVESICNRYGVPDPARWLATLMTGYDPRPMDAPILEMIRKIVYRDFDESGDPFPDESEWSAIVEHVLGSELYTKSRVSVQESHKAASKLMDFLHKQQKSGTLAIKQEDTKPLELPPITDEDLNRVKKIFNDVF